MIERHAEDRESYVTSYAGGGEVQASREGRSRAGADMGWKCFILGPHR